MDKKHEFDTENYRQVGDPLDCNNGFRIIIRSQDQQAGYWRRRTEGKTDRTYSLWLQKGSHPALSREFINEEFRNFPDSISLPDGSARIAKLETAVDEEVQPVVSALVRGADKVMQKYAALRLDETTQNAIITAITDDLVKNPPLKIAASSKPQEQNR